MKMAAPEISLQQLVDKFQLSQDQLDREVSEEHLREVSRIIDDHEIVGPELGLTPEEITAIDRDARTHEHRKKATLRKWKQKFPLNATYRTLIEALLTCGRGYHAVQVSKLLTHNVNKTRREVSSQSGRKSGATGSTMEQSSTDRGGHRNCKEFTRKNVVNALHDAGFSDADCEQLALQLDLSEQMVNIRANNPRVEISLQNMIEKWIKKDPNASWEPLAAALERIYGPATAIKFQQAVGLPADNGDRETTPISAEETPGEDQRGMVRNRAVTGTNQGQEEGANTPHPSPPLSTSQSSVMTALEQKSFLIIGVLVTLLIVLSVLLLLGLYMY